MGVVKMKNLKTKNQVNRNQEIKSVKEKDMKNHDEFLIKDEGSQLKRYMPRVNPVKKETTPAFCLNPPTYLTLKK